MLHAVTFVDEMHGWIGDGRKSLHTSDGAVQWVTTGYLLAMAVAIPVTGWAESRWGGKRVWMAALVLFVAGSVLCAVAWTTPA